MNTRRVAALLRELADAIDEPAPVVAPKPKRRPVAMVLPPPPSPEMLSKVQRAVRRLSAGERR